MLNACDPRFNEPIFDACFDARVTYLDMAMTLSEPHPERPYELPGRMLGEHQFAAPERWEQAGLLALVGIGVEPGLSDVFARYAADQLFSQIDEIGVRDGADLVVEGYDFAPTFSIWTTIEECLNPPLVWERERGFHTTAPFSEPEMFDVPRGHRPGRVRERRARGGRADPALGRLRARHVQVRARPRVHRRAAHAAQTRPRLDRAGACARRRRWRRATSSPRRCPTRRRSASA